jgi:hypothetical protein
MACFSCSIRRISEHTPVTEGLSEEEDELVV